MNLGLVIVLVIFLLFAFGVGNSAGQWYCSKSEEEAASSMTSALVYLLLSGLFGYWGYYIYCQETRQKYTRLVHMTKTAEFQGEDPNESSGNAAHVAARGTDAQQAATVGPTDKKVDDDNPNPAINLDQ